MSVPRLRNFRTTQHQTRVIMTPASDGEQKVVLSRESHGAHDVCRAAAAHDRTGATIDFGVRK
jgi:hypothetical protein